ncbi:MAG: hypothetical protein ACYC5G_04540 [Candidatus Doudnabacteria bacterium]
MTITKTKSHIKIAQSEWEELKKNPETNDTIDLLKGMSDLEKAKKVTVKGISLEAYLKKYGI